MDSQHHHIVSLKTNFIIFMALVFLTILTVLTAQIHFNETLHVLLALFIATVKVILVALWFMHLKYDSKANKVIFVSGLFFVFLMFLLTGIDFLTR